MSILSIDYAAHLLCTPKEQIDKAILKQANKACAGENPTNKDYWNALAHAGQMHGNVPKTMCVALVYKFLTES